jgi:hypothetical protein
MVMPGILHIGSTLVVVGAGGKIRHFIHMSGMGTCLVDMLRQRSNECTGKGALPCKVGSSLGDGRLVRLCPFEDVLE